MLRENPRKEVIRKNFFLVFFSDCCESEFIDIAHYRGESQRKPALQHLNLHIVFWTNEYEKTRSNDDERSNELTMGCVRNYYLISYIYIIVDIE